MSYIFDIAGETVWSPALRVGKLYVQLTRAVAEASGLPTGFRAVAEDMIDIDPLPFEGLVRDTFKTVFSTEHFVYREQLRGWLLTSLVLLKRTGISIQPETEEQRSFLQPIDTYERSMPA